MLPSPSLGPPLLSASWSPPLFCGMPAVALLPPEPALGLAVDPLAAALLFAGGIDAEVDDPPEPYPPPQPATARTSAATAAGIAILALTLNIRVAPSRRGPLGGRSVRTLSSCV